VHIKLKDRGFMDIGGLNRGLHGLAINAVDSFALEEILNSAMQSLYRAQPEGQVNYGGESPLVGKVWLC